MAGKKKVKAAPKKEAAKKSLKGSKKVVEPKLMTTPPGTT
jgi:hypothetical protein